MTDKEKAEEILQTKGCNTFCVSCGYTEKVIELIAIGLAEGRKEKWHDLRKDPNDLPKLADKRFPWSITVSNQNGEACEYNYRLSHWQNCLSAEIDEPIAWCELPKFEEQEND